MSYDVGVMALLLPGENPSPPWFQVLIAIAVVFGLCAFGCATTRGRHRGGPASISLAVRHEAKHPAPPPRKGDEGAAFVVRTLHDVGFRFGTDGSTRALWGYLRTAHRVVAANKARAGDIVFFDTRDRNRAPTCADRTGVVEKVSPDGRITFVEARDGRVRRGFVDPARPAQRRGPRGEILNSFLRPIRIDDPPGTRYFAGQMLCGVARAF